MNELIEKINQIDQHCMTNDQRPKCQNWIKIAEETLGENNVTNWTDLYNTNPLSITSLIDQFNGSID